MSVGLRSASAATRRGHRGRPLPDVDESRNDSELDTEDEGPWDEEEEEDLGEPEEEEYDEEAAEEDADPHDEADEPEQDDEEGPETHEDSADRDLGADGNDDPEPPQSLLELAAAINQAHERCRRCHEESNKYVLLLAVRRRVPRRFQEWLTENVRVSIRQAQRYIQVAEQQGALDDLNPQWRTDWSPSQALAELAQSKKDDVQEESTEPDSSDEHDEAEERDDEASKEEPEEFLDSTEDAVPREVLPMSAKQLREAKAAHRRRVEQLPEFLKSGAIKFGRNAQGLRVLQELGAAYRKEALAASRQLHNSDLEERGHDVGLIAMALVQMLPEKLPVDRLFQPKP
jgi:hypothetical protein